MEYSELILHRHSCRAYLPKPVEDEKLMKVLEAARLAPTAANRQPFQLIVIHTQGRQAELAKIYHRDWFVQAPLLICAVGVPAEGWVRSDDHRRYLDVDVAIVVDHMTLAAADLGLGTCWIANFNAARAREAFQVPDDQEPIILITLGYPADEPKVKERKAVADLVRYL